MFQISMNIYIHIYIENQSKNFSAEIELSAFCLEKKDITETVFNCNYDFVLLVNRQRVSDILMLR